jgi:phage N-6-adenine-methyltransferase
MSDAKDVVKSLFIPARKKAADKDEWRTPLALYGELNREFQFRLDAACTQANCLAPQGLTRDTGRDGLLEQWTPGPVFVNPPYSQRQIYRWAQRAALAGQSETVAMLITAATASRWWRQWVAGYAAEVRFITGRLCFRRPNGCAAGNHFAPSCIVIWRPGASSGSGPAVTWIDRPTESTGKRSTSKALPELAGAP